MGDSLDDSELPPKNESWAESNAHDRAPVADLRQDHLLNSDNKSTKSAQNAEDANSGSRWALPERASQRSRPLSNSSRKYDVSSNPTAAAPPPAPPPINVAAAGNTYTSIGSKRPLQKPNIFIRMREGIKRFFLHTKVAILSSRVNYLLVFVPVGMAVKFTGADQPVVFSLNALAVVPLANLLSYATESAAMRLGDTVGALLNITFGNAVEVIIL